MSGVDTESQPPPSGPLPHVYRNLRPPWKKGETGNPHKKNLGFSEYDRVRRLCADKSVEATGKLIKLMDDGDMAVSAVLDRGVGKPRDHSDEDNALSRRNLAALSDDEQRLLMGLLRRVMGVESPAPQIEASAAAGSTRLPS